MSDDVAKALVEAARTAVAALCRELAKALPPAEGADVAATYSGVRYLVADTVEEGHPFVTASAAPGVRATVQPYPAGGARAAGIADGRWPAGSTVRAMRQDGRTTWVLEP